MRRIEQPAATGSRHGGSEADVANLDRINLLNVALMLASCAAALRLPFELFLFSYVLLGPLHYLTEIAWLHSRGYFTTGRRDYVVLGALCVCLAVINFVPLGLRDPNYWGTTVMIAAFAAALVMALVANPYAKIATFATALVVAASLGDVRSMQVWFVVFLPTIVHVYLFTGAFILFGALKSRSASGIASLAVFAGCTAALFVFPATATPGGVGVGIRQHYQSFSGVNLHLSAWLPLPALRDVNEVYTTATGVLLMRLIAFSYTYHYLNWFSKTSVIQWHKIPRPWAVVNLGLWTAALGLYAWDYTTALKVLFMLSFLHVFLEFPLDHRTFVAIARELGTMVRPPRLTPAPVLPASPRRQRANGRARRPDRAAGRH